MVTTRKIFIRIYDFPRGLYAQQQADQVSECEDVPSARGQVTKVRIL